MGQNEIERYAGAILNDPRFQKLRSFEHHGPANTVYDHSLAVTRAAYRIACALHLSRKDCVGRPCGAAARFLRL